MSSPFERPMERRNIDRRPCRATVRVFLEPDSEDLCFSLDSTDLSPDGVFLRSDLLFPVGHWLDVEFQVPGRTQPVRSRGQVVRVAPQRRAPGPGMALCLPDLNAEERNALARLGAPSRRPG